MISDNATSASFWGALRNNGFQSADAICASAPEKIAPSESSL
jgi:hypothetical protein